MLQGKVTVVRVGECCLVFLSVYVCVGVCVCVCVESVYKWMSRKPEL